MDIRNKVVLVTGGAGTIGCNLAVALLDQDCKVIVVDDLSSGQRGNVPTKATFIEGSIMDDNILEKAFSHEPKIIFHLAANFANKNSVDHPEKDLLVNGIGTLKVLEWAQKNEIYRFVYSSSSCVYGNKEISKEDDLDFSSNTPYAITKLLGEKYVTYFHEMFGMKTIIVRYFNCYGPGEMPGDYRSVIPNFIKLAMEGKQLLITGTGEESRDFTYVSDVVAATILVVEKDETVSGIFNIGTGKETKILELAKVVNKIVGNKAGIELKEKRIWDKVSQRRADIEKIKKVGYEPNVGLEEGIKKTYQWLKMRL